MNKALWGLAFLLLVPNLILGLLNGLCSSILFWYYQFIIQDGGLSDYRFLKFQQGFFLANDNPLYRRLKR
jgi:hypothetical protein